MHTKTKILILDDYADLLEALTIFLEGQSFEVCTVGHEESFKAELMRFKPDVIILDVDIKGICDGRKICKMIKSNMETKHIPVILMSASIPLLKNYEECNADAVINKPFDLVLLLEKIRALAHRNIGEVLTRNRDEMSCLISLIDKSKPYENIYAG
ncbi:MAG TPA: response regulator [Chitinophagaceae bacterium]|nr:response regulator [Chitinophagaceae bacterium]